MDREKQELLSNLQKEVLQKTKDFTDALKKNIPSRELDTIYREIQSLYNRIFEVKQFIANSKNSQLQIVSSGHMIPFWKNFIQLTLWISSVSQNMVPEHYPR